MGWFSFLSNKNNFLTKEENQQIVAAIRAAESKTSGEVRLFMESKCAYINPMDRAQEVFFGLQMDKTVCRNGVLLYIATEDHQLAIFGDEAIYHQLGDTWWHEVVKQLIISIKAKQMAEGICAAIDQIGSALTAHFPYHNEDKNELPDEIIFGR